MATFEITSPDGQTYEVTAPDNATEAQVMSYAQSQFKTGETKSAIPEKFDPTEGQSFAQNAWQAFGGLWPKASQAVRQISLDAAPTLSRMYGFKPAGVEKLVAPSKAKLQAEINETKRLEAPLNNTWGGTVGGVARNVATSLPFMMVPGANTLVGSALTGAGMGALEPVADGESRMKNMTISGVLGPLGYAGAKGYGALAKSASNRISKIEADTAAKAASEAASETASARSAAGNAAQDAYRQLEHLRELNAMGLLTPEGKQIAADLEKELGKKAADKLLPAAAKKKATAEAYSEAMSTEEKRAADLVAKKLSSGEVKNQIMARLKRYGPAAIGGMIGHSILPGIGAGAGAVAGLYLRPAIRSVVNLSKNPAVQRKMLMPIANTPMLTNPAVPQYLGLLGPSIYAAQE